LGGRGDALERRADDLRFLECFATALRFLEARTAILSAVKAVMTRLASCAAASLGAEARRRGAGKAVAR
jgi:hypothetical protein